MVGGKAQRQRPDCGTYTVEQQVTARRITGQADGYRHDRAQAVDEAKAQHPDVRMATDMLQRTVTHGLPARLAREDLAPVAPAHEIPQLIASVAAAKGHQHHQLDVHVFAEREEPCKYQNGLAFEEGA